MDDGALYQLAWTWGAGALRTRWKLIGVGRRMCGKVRVGASVKVEDENGALERHQPTILASSSLTSASRSTAPTAFLGSVGARRAQGADCGGCAATLSPQPRLRSCPSWSWLREALGSWWALVEREAVEGRVGDRDGECLSTLLAQPTILASIVVYQALAFSSARSSTQ